MNTKTTSTRRSFLKSGAMLAAPLAAAVPSAVKADDELRARLARLEDESSIRKLHQLWVQQMNAGAGAATPLFVVPEDAAFRPVVRSIAADHTGQPDVIEVAADGKSAAGRFPCAVEMEETIAPDCTLAQMAHAQGGGFVRRMERRLLKVEYVKVSGEWAIKKIEFTPV